MTVEICPQCDASVQRRTRSFPGLVPGQRTHVREVRCMRCTWTRWDVLADPPVGEELHDPAPDEPHGRRQQTP
jgi:hypothetical protein